MAGSGVVLVVKVCTVVGVVAVVGLVDVGVVTTLTGHFRSETREMISFSRTLTLH